MIECNNEAKADDADIEECNTLNTRALTYEIDNIVRKKGFS